MKKLFLTVKEIVQITGIAPRILHYYDKINLLKPSHKKKIVIEFMMEMI